MQTVPDASAAGPSGRSLLCRLLRLLKSTAVFAFVCWHLFFLFLRNPADLWEKEVKKKWGDHDYWKEIEPYYEPANRWTDRYGNLFGLDQGWKMFTPPIARKSWFLTARLHFSDGSSDLLPSENDLGTKSYVRIGGWRQRKLEDEGLEIFDTAAELRADKEELALWEAHARWSLERWRTLHPNDSRTVEKVALFLRRMTFPKPEEDPTEIRILDQGVIAEFNADGRLLR